MSQNQNARVFGNKVMEAFTRTHIAWPLVIFYTMAAGLVAWNLYYGFISPLSNLYMFLAGFFLFTLVEYIVHRHAFHLDSDHPKAVKMKYAFHGVHHADPKDKKRLAMPPFVSVSIAVVFLVVYKVIMGYYGLPFTAGFVSGYATYLVVHYSVHVFRPPRNFLRILWVHHAIHHYQQDDRAFGVSSPLWDFVFRTMPRQTTVAIKQRADN